MKKIFLVVYALLIASSLGLTGPASAHEPLFGLGPHTVGQYAWALESELERGHEGWANHYELAYGITPDIVLTTALPYVFADNERKAGFGDLVVRGKYRFLRLDVLNASTAFALHWGLKFPTGSRSEHRGSGTTDYFLGLSFGHEGRKNYAFADVRYQVNGSVENVKQGNAINIDAAYGIRPWQLEYLQPDLVLLVEMLGEATSKNSIRGIDDANSGGYTLSIAPGFLFSYRNMMFKGGVKFAVLDKLNGVQERLDTEFLFSVEFHMPPFK
ncbi:MAG: transporter [bacterium]